MEQKLPKVVHADDDVSSENETVSVNFDGRVKLRWKPTWKSIGIAGVTIAGGAYAILDFWRKVLEIME